MTKTQSQSISDTMQTKTGFHHLHHHHQPSNETAFNNDTQHLWPAHVLSLNGCNGQLYAVEFGGLSPSLQHYHNPNTIKPYQHPSPIIIPTSIPKPSSFTNHHHHTSSSSSSSSSPLITPTTIRLKVPTFMLPDIK